MDTLNELRTLFSYLTQPPYCYYAAVAGGLVLLLLVVRFYRSSQKGITPFKSQGGSIEIAPHTLRGVIQNAAQSVEGVQKCSCQHFIKRRQVGVKVRIHLRANHPLRDVEAKIKERIRFTLMEQFGMETVDPIHIRVAGIVGKPIAQEHYTALSGPKPSARTESAPRETSIPFIDEETEKEPNP